MWHHSVAKNEPYEGDFEHFFEQLFLTGESESGLYFDFVLPYCKATDRWSENVKSDAPKPFSQITTIWYETMTKEPLETVAALAAFLGIDASIERLRSICETCCFESMKELESKYGTRLSSRILEHDSSSGDKETASMSHIRKGGVGGWRSYLSEDQSARLDALSAEKCREHGATLPSIS